MSAKGVGGTLVCTKKMQVFFWKNFMKQKICKKLCTPVFIMIKKRNLLGDSHLERREKAPPFRKNTDMY